MNYLLYDFDLQTNDKIQITLDHMANIRLLDSINYNNYKNGMEYRYYGGLVEKSPFTLTTPAAGKWFLVIDLQGMGGSVNATVKVLR